MAKLENNCVFIPGWLDVAENYGFSPGLEIWAKKIDPKQKLEFEYAIGYSLGANFALLNWQENKNTKLILINPAVYPKPAFSWFLSWLKFAITEKPIIHLNQLKAIIRLFSGIKMAHYLFKQDYLKIISEIPKENILVLRGEEDRFLCDKKTKEMFKKKGIRVLEITGEGHDCRGRNFGIKVKKILEKYL